MSTAAITVPPPSSAAKNVLILSGDAGLDGELRDALAPEGYHIRTVDAARYESDHSSADGVDLIVLDCASPASVGLFGACASPGAASVGGPPLLLIVAERCLSDLDRLGATGAADFLLTPLRPTEIRQRVRFRLSEADNPAARSSLSSVDSDRVAIVAHDLRNPLVSIRALSHLVRTGTTGPVNPHQRDLLDTVYETSDSMLNLIDLMVRHAAGGENGFLIKRTAVSLAELAAASVNLQRPAASEKDSTVIWEPGPLPPLVSGDPLQLRRVLDNVIGNAVKFSPPGSQIVVRTAVRDSYCSLVVCDQGPGIPVDDRQHLFSKHGRLSATPTAGESSSGLGLWISDQIMRAHAGSIHVENLPGGGAAFHLNFPLSP